jgi:hypothetical protein
MSMYGIHRFQLANTFPLNEEITFTVLVTRTKFDIVNLKRLIRYARERDPDDWKDLFRWADSRFEFLMAFKPEKRKMWIVEATWNASVVERADNA